jgi:hypothetical protein
MLEVAATCWSLGYTGTIMFMKRKFSQPHCRLYSWLLTGSVHGLSSIGRTHKIWLWWLHGVWCRWPMISSSEHMSDDLVLALIVISVPGSCFFTALLAPGRLDARVCSPFPVLFHAPTQGPRHPEPHQHREEGEGAADASRHRAEEETLSRGNRRQGGRWNTWSNFKTFRYNTCNICLKADETLETCIWNNCKNTWITLETIAKTYVTSR